MPHGHHALDTARGRAASRPGEGDAEFVCLEETEPSGGATNPGPVTDAVDPPSLRDMHQHLMESHPLPHLPRWHLPKVRTRVSSTNTTTTTTNASQLDEQQHVEVSQLQTFKALLKKNWRLKTRGAALWCFVLELLVPVAFVALMCLPRLLVPDTNSPSLFHRTAPIESLSWSRKPPSARAVRVIYAPDTPAHRAVAEAAAVTLVCGTDIRNDTGSNLGADGATTGAQPTGTPNASTLNPPPSFAQQAAAAAALDVDLGALLGASGSGGGAFGQMGPNPSGTGGSNSPITIDPAILAACLDNPMACAASAASVVSFRENPPVPLDGALMVTPEELRETFCVSSCVDDPVCRRSVLNEFLVGVDTKEQAEALALGKNISGLDISLAYQPAMAVVTMPLLLKPSANSVEYVIRVNASDTPTGYLGPKWYDEKFVRWVVGEDDGWREYWTYVNVQRAFDQALLSLSLMDDTDFLATDDQPGPESPVTNYPLPRGIRLDIELKAYPFPSYSTNLGSTYAAVFFGLAFVFAFVVAVAQICQNVVTEKELKLRQGMRVMGMRNPAYWGSWFVTSYASLLLVSFLVAVTGAYPFQYTNWTVTFTFLAVWSAQLVAFCFFLSTLFADGKIASVVGSLCYILTWTPGVAVVSASPEGSTMWLTSTFLMPASGVYMWGWAVAILENAQTGMTWQTLFTNLLEGDESGADASGVFSAGGVLFIALGNFFAYAGLAWAIDTGLFSKLKTFVFQKRSSVAPDRYKIAARVSAGAMDESAIPGGVETETQVHGRVRVRPAIRVAGVTKRFGNNSALDGMSFAARTGEITALLGHNGAGKTTTFGVLTGSVLPDAGAAWINGVDVSCNQTKAHATLGVCPQFDVLWPSLTVREHLELFASFRPLRGAVAANSTSAADSSTCAAAYKDVVRLEIEKKLVAVGLMDDAERPAGTLSGGQRRKLSLAIAFIGDPDVVLLDEPTAGMDPLSRRHAWDVIRGLAGRSDVATSGDDTKECGADFSAANSPPTRKATSVLLTTHFMDEADALSDRVCVVHGGRLAAAGSPLFVKTAFGGGYSLRVRCVTATIDSESTEIFQLVTAAVPGATLARVETPPGRSDSSQKKEVILCFNLPSCATQHFPKALRALESAAGKQLGVQECSVGCATLEDAFLNVAEKLDGIKCACGEEAFGTGSEEATGSFLRADEPDCKSAPEPEKPRRVGKALFASHVRATFWKRAVHCRRELFAVSMGTVVAPLLFVIAGLAASSVARAAVGDPLSKNMNDWAFLGDLPIGVGSSGGRDAFVSSSQLSSASRPTELIAMGGDALTMLAGGETLTGVSSGDTTSPASNTFNGDRKARLLPFAGVDTLWDCEVDSNVLDACVNNCDTCGPFESLSGGGVGDSLEGSLRSELWDTISQSDTFVTTANRSSESVQPVFSGFASLDGVLLAVAKPRATCRVGFGGLATCASLFVEPGGLSTKTPIPRNSPRRFGYVVAVSSTAYHALPATMALTHDAIWKAMHVGSVDDEEEGAEDDENVGNTTTVLSVAGQSAVQNTARTHPSLTSINHPLPSTSQEKQEREVLSRLLVSLCAVIGLAALSSASAPPFLVREHASGAKHLQITSGLKLGGYWFGTYLWDICSQTPTLSLVVLAFVAFNADVITGDSLASLVAALFLFLLASTPLSYLVSIPFTSPAAAVAAQLGGYVFFGVAQLVAGVTLGGLAETGQTKGGAYDAWQVMKVVFLYLPHYCVGRVVFDLSGGFGEPGEWAEGEIGSDMVSGDTKQQEMPDTTRDALVALAITAVVYSLCVLLVERVVDASPVVEFVFAQFKRFKRKTTPVSLSDPELALPEAPAEAIYVGGVTPNGGLSTQQPRPVLVVDGLRKKYATARTLENARAFAVDEVSFSVNACESFALLGVNGAGKTTTFEMLTGAIAPTEGDATVRVAPRDVGVSSGEIGHSGSSTYSEVSLRKDADTFRRVVGYCPQRDALLGNLTGWEHLLFYGALRGLDTKSAACAARALASAVGLDDATASRPSREYSGGAKRKLAVAIALVGDPQAVLLDEPSTGMDPRSRRKLWVALQLVAKQKKVATVLTSHSMEEAEALCGRVGLMRAGVLTKVGDAESWRCALGSGHTLEVKVSEGKKVELEAFVAKLAAGDDVSSPDEIGTREIVGQRTDDSSHRQRACVMKFKLPLSISTAAIFESLEKHRVPLGIEDYQLGRTTLEETFLAFAAVKEEGEE